MVHITDRLYGPFEDTTWGGLDGPLGSNASAYVRPQDGQHCWAHMESIPKFGTWNLNLAFVSGPEYAAYDSVDVSLKLQAKHLCS